MTFLTHHGLISVLLFSSLPLPAYLVSSFSEDVISIMKTRKADLMTLKKEVLPSEQSVSLCEGGEALDLVAMGNRGCPIPVNVQGQVRWSLSTLV